MIEAGNTFQNIVFAPNGSWVVIGANNYRDYSGGFPDDAYNLIEAMIKVGNTFQNIVFAPNGSWVVVGANNYRDYSGGFPQYAFDACEAMIAGGGVLNSVIFFPNWSVVATGIDNSPQPGPDICDVVQSFLQDFSAASPLLNIVVSQQG